MPDQVFEFKTEVRQLLDLMIHSLYSHKEIFLRELISNAADAIDKVRYLSLTDNAILEGEADWKIKIRADRNAGTLTVSDNGIGMNQEEIIHALGTIAHSGTKDFIGRLKEQDVKDHPELIGQFGVGFYSSFMVAGRIVVVSRKAGDPADKAVRWESRGDGTFMVEPFERHSRGTDVILYLKDSEKNYLDEWEIRGVVRKYSDYVEHPVCMDVEKDKKTQEETLNSRKAIWLKDKNEITAEEYNEFYKHIAHDFNEPAKVIHFKAEGAAEFTALMFIPSKAPFDLFYRDYKIGPVLYVRRVQIMDHCGELLPPYLRFVKGVVESSDLPLNVSREILQANKQIEVIRKNLVKKALDTLTDLKTNDYEKYLAVYNEFRKPLKEGVYLDPPRRDTLKDLLLFESTKTEAGKYTSLKAYAENMKPGQKEIYFIAGDSRGEMETSPYLEAFRAKDYEVLFFTDEIDDFIAADLEYQGKPVKSVVRGDIELDKEQADVRRDAEKKFDKMLDVIRAELKDDVKEVRFSGRLKDSVCCLVADEQDLDANMERLLKAMGQAPQTAKRILEINSAHELVASMDAIFKTRENESLIREYARMLYDQALILEGSRPKDPVQYAHRVSKIMVEHSTTISQSNK